MFNTPLHRRHWLQSLGVAALAGGPGAVRAAVSKGERVAWPEVGLLDGQRFGARQVEGHAVVAVFWSVTCPFCRRHNEHVEKLHRAAKGKPLTVLGISRDTDVQAVRRYVAEKGYTFPVTMDAAPLMAQLAARNVIPLTVTIDRRGRFLQAYPGEMFEEDVLELLALADAGPRS